jgi:hypothetical protein
MGLVVDPRPADVDGRGVFDDAFFLRIPVEADDRAQPSGDSGAGPAGVLEIAGEAFDVDTVDVKQAAVVLPAPGGELAQIQRVSVASEPAVASQEPEQRRLLDLAEHRLVPLDRGRRCGHGGTSLVEVGATNHNATGTSDR